MGKATWSPSKQFPFRKSALTFGVLCLAMVTAGEQAERSWPGPYPRPTGLTGLRSVAVTVYADSSIPSDRIAAGPFRDEIKRRIAQELQSAGISITTNESDADALLTASLYLVCESNGPSCGHHTHLQLKQWVRLDRDRNTTLAATTWENSYTNGISKKDIWCCLPDQLELDALTLIHAFSRDYRTANPH